MQGERKFGGYRIYGQSKLANVLFTYELARRLEGSSVTANCLHPGVVATGFGRNNTDLFGRLFGTVMSGIRPFLMSPERGAETSIHLAASPEVEGVSGKYFSGKKPVRSSPETYDEAAARRLWQLSEDMTQSRTAATGSAP